MEAQLETKEVTNMQSGKLLAACVVLMTVLVLAGCGGATSPTKGGVVVDSKGVHTLQKVGGVALADYRWKDIAGNAYSTAFASTFDYGTGPQVTVNYDDAAGTLQGTVNATGLKPNFAYQIKLEGKPTKVWGTAGDDWSNERIGYLGRWWCATDVANRTDAQYAVCKALGHTVTGYLLFDFLLTDQSGNASKPFHLDSSYHVLWNTQQGAPGANDRPSQVRTLAFTDFGYGSPYPAVTTETIYPEWEPGRPTPGTAQFGAGQYKCTFLLTEESFHGWPSSPGGNWAAALRDTDLQFTVTAPTVHDLAVTAINTATSIRQKQATSVGVVVANQGTVSETTAVTLTATSGTVSPASRSVTVAPGASATASFTWTPAAKGSQKLTATAQPVTGETDTADNVRTKNVNVK
jgi:hypothetical protein